MYVSNIIVSSCWATNMDGAIDYVNDGMYGSFNCILFDHHVVHPKGKLWFCSASDNLSDYGLACSFDEE